MDESFPNTQYRWICNISLLVKLVTGNFNIFFHSTMSLGNLSLFTCHIFIASKSLVSQLYYGGIILM